MHKTKGYGGPHSLPRRIYGTQNFSFTSKLVLILSCSQNAKMELKMWVVSRSLI